MDKILFAGSASFRVGRELANILEIPIGNYSLNRFSNSEIKVTIRQDVKNKQCFIVQSTANPANDHIIELFFLIDALKRGQAAEINIIIPDFGYARQNIAHLPGEAVSAHVVIDILEHLGASRIITVDLHDEATAGVFSVPFTNASALPMLAREVGSDMKNKSIRVSDLVVGTPDQGGIERARLFAKYFISTNRDIIIVEKKRNLKKIHISKSVEIYGNVKNKHVVLVDDISTSGSTLINAAKMCMHKGAKAVTAVIVHADFAKGVVGKIQRSPISALYTTNTIEKVSDSLDKYGPFIKVLSVASVIADVI